LINNRQAGRRNRGRNNNNNGRPNGQNRGGGDSGNRIVAPFLRAIGVRRLHGLIVSHDDSDHSGGAVSILQALPVAWLASPLDEMDPLPLLADRAFACAAGQSWEWDGVHFEILHPPKELAAATRNNDRGCVLKARAPGGTILIPADIERRSEDDLLAHANELRADVLIAGHHGSKTSSTPAFVSAVDPRIVVFSVGYRNRFGHPHADVVERFRAIGSRVYRSDMHGAVLMSFQPGGPVAVTAYRSFFRRYWLDSPEPD